MKKISRRSFLTAAAACGAAAALTACGGSSSSAAASSTAGSTAASAAAGPVTLQWSVWDKESTPYWQAMADGYMASHKDVTIEMVDLGSSDYMTVLATQLAGSADLDIVTIKDIPGYANLINLDYLKPLNEVLTRDTGDFNGTIEQLTTDDGNFYAVPFRSDFWVLYYNKDRWTDFCTVRRAVSRRFARSFPYADGKNIRTEELQMIQVCDPPRQRQVRRLSAEEFFTLVRCGGAGFYRPCSEVLRMLTAGEAWGTAGAALLVLPLTADTAAAAALRNWLGRRQLEGGCLLTPPVNTGEELPTRLVEIAAARADRLRRKGTAWAVVECTETAAALLPLYFRQGFGLRALRPLESLAPCFLLCTGCAPVRTAPVWVPLEDRVQLARLLAKGYAALDSRPYGGSLALALYPLKETE